jgi:hypothetical protein
MNTQQDSIECMDFGDATTETKQYWISVEYPDNIFGRGPYPGWLEVSVEREKELTAL